MAPTHLLLLFFVLVGVIHVGHATGAIGNVLLSPDISEEKPTVKVGGSRVSSRKEGAGFTHVDFDTSAIYDPAEAATLHNDPRKAMFFLEEDLHSGKKMKLNFGESAIREVTLRRRVVDSPRVDASTMVEVMKMFSVKPGTDDSNAMEKTVKECSSATKHCATSLESMVEFAKASLGTREVTTMSTELTAAVGEVTGEKEYQVTKVERVPGTMLVACHSLPYPYAVFYCHSSGTTRAYKVSMVAGEKDDAGVVKTVAVCHKDTGGWNPKHLAFQVLKVKPGTAPVCHFLPMDHLVLAPTM